MSGSSGFLEKVIQASRRQQTLLCVGLDVDLAAMPEHVAKKRDAIVTFNRAIVDATADLVCAFKPNLAFYEALGPAGLEALQRTLEFIPAHVPVIGDAKRGDIGSSAQMYARAIFEVYRFDACTVNPLLGYDSVEPFLAYRDRCTFLLCRTSNPGGRDFQDLRVLTPRRPEESFTFFENVARRVQEWNVNGNCGLVVGATVPDELRRVRALAPDLPLLIPGVGTQGGDLAAAVRFGVNRQGELAIINSSRQVLYSSRGKDFAAAARKAAMKLRDEINTARAECDGR